MMNRIVHVAEFGGGGGQQVMGERSMRPVEIEGLIGEFVHRLESLLDEMHILFVVSDLRFGSTPRQFTHRSGGSRESRSGLRMRVERRLESDQIQCLVGIGLSLASLDRMVEEFLRPLASEEFE